MTNYPVVEGELHSHGDGFMHIHPGTPQFSGNNASLGTFLRLYETNIGILPDGKRFITFPDGSTFKDGDGCPGSKKRYNLELENKGDKIEGDPAAFLPHEGDAVVISFGPKGEKPFPNPYAKAKGLQEPGTGGREQPAPD